MIKYTGPRSDGRSFSNGGRPVFTRRAAMLLAGQVGVLGLLSRRLYDIQVEGRDELGQQAERNRTATRLLTPPRGRIVDRAGALVAGNQTTWRVLYLPDSGGDLDETLTKIGEFVQLSPADALRIERARKRSHRFVPIVLKDYLTWDEMSRVASGIPQLPGVVIDAGVRRIYPHKALLAHLGGYVAPPSETDLKKDVFYELSGIRVGRGGIEQTQEDALRGRAGMLEEEVDAHGKVLRALKKTPPVPGGDLALTIDAELQERIAACLGDRVASATVLDCRTGAVCAMLSTPSFDPGAFDSGISAARWRALLDDPKTPLVNKAVSGLYPPGSTFKPVVALAALKCGAIDENEKIFCPGYFDVGKTRFHCWNRFGHGNVDVHDAIKYSCDVYFYQAARRCGMEVIQKAGADLGLGVSLPIELPHVATGVVPTPSWRAKRGFHWSVGDTVNAGIGQGFVQSTPLSLAVYAAGLASGRRISPYLIGGRQGAGGWQAAEAARGAPLPFSRRHLDIVRSGMFAVVNDPNGTAPLARIDVNGMRMAGKTGSAQVRHVSRAMRESGRFNSANLPWLYRPHALFICYAPYDDPRYAASLVVEHGNAGAKEAAPLAAQIMRETLAINPVLKRDGLKGRLGSRGVAV